MRRRPDVTADQFRQYWNDPQFIALIERTVALTGALRYSKNATLHVQANVTVQELRGTGDPYDGVLEYWWDNAAELIARTQSAEGRALTAEMLAYQRQFVDLTRSTAFFTEA
jgi:hypothetical protein